MRAFVRIFFNAITKYKYRLETKGENRIVYFYHATVCAKSV